MWWTSCRSMESVLSSQATKPRLQPGSHRNLYLRTRIWAWSLPGHGRSSSSPKAAPGACRLQARDVTQFDVSPVPQGCRARWTVLSRCSGSWRNTPPGALKRRLSSMRHACVFCLHQARSIKLFCFSQKVHQLVADQSWTLRTSPQEARLRSSNPHERIRR